jgi:hypothetical protein
MRWHFFQTWPMMNIAEASCPYSTSVFNTFIDIYVYVCQAQVMSLLSYLLAIVICRVMCLFCMVMKSSVAQKSSGST